MIDLERNNLVDRIKNNLAIVNDRIDSATRRAGRSSSDVKLVVVTKTQPFTSVDAAFAAGVKRFGENYAEQAVGKIETMRSYPDLEWHMIGHIQSRKAGLVSRYFDYVHSVDSLKLAQRLDRLAGEVGKVIPILLEINVGGEESKSGWQVVENESLHNFYTDVEELVRLPNLNISGLMTMPPLMDNPENARSYFRQLRVLRDTLSHRFPGTNWYELSMGTSADYEVAVEEGATFIRVGQAILGTRPER